MNSSLSNWKEGDFEDWFVEDPKLPPENEPLLIVSKEIQLHRMADVVALDSDGGIVIIEVKNERSTREAVGQSLEYLALYRDVEIDELARQYTDCAGGSEADLGLAFQEKFKKPLTAIARRRRIYIVAPSFDPYSAACARFLGQVLLPGETEYHLLCAKEQGGGFQLTPYDPDLVHTTKLAERQFAMSAANWIYRVMNAGPQPVLWKIGKKKEGRDLCLLGKGKTLAVAKRWLVPIPRPKEIEEADESITGTSWVRKANPHRTATVIGVVTLPRRRGIKTRLVVLVMFDHSILRGFYTKDLKKFRRVWQQVPPRVGLAEWQAFVRGA